MFDTLYNSSGVRNLEGYMTNPMINPQPSYSGVTIQIANPAVYAGGNGGFVSGNTSSAFPAPQSVTLPQQQGQQAYPPQYYLNNYNYQAPNGKAIETSEVKNKLPEITNEEKKDVPSESFHPEDMTKSQGIIDDLDTRDAKAKADKENGKQKRVVALTDEYIKSLENYLNNPNEEIRLMASKEILTRLDEDKSRYDDAALNALLNKMLQDPSKLIRVASLSAFSSQLASGNDYTIQLLHNIQSNPSADKEDVIQAADILLKMSAGTEVKNIPDPAVKEEPSNGGN